MEELNNIIEELKNETPQHNPVLVKQTGMDEDEFTREMIKGLESGGMSGGEYEKRTALRIKKLKNENNRYKRVRGGHKENS